MPAKRLTQFVDDIGRARDLVGLGQSLGGLTHRRVDGSDLFRAALVQSVAAVDAYVHGVVLDRAVAMLTGQLPISGSETRVGLHFTAVQAIVSAQAPVDLELAARTHIAERLSRETFQRPNDIARAMAMVGVTKIWSTAFAPDSNPATTALGVAVDRRNRIVHSCDIDPLNPGAVTPLSDADALTAINTAEHVVHGIDPYC